MGAFFVSCPLRPAQYPLRLSKMYCFRLLPVRIAQRRLRNHNAFTKSHSTRLPLNTSPIRCKTSEAYNTSPVIKESTLLEYTTNDICLDNLSPMMRHYALTKQKLSQTLCQTSTRRLLLLYRVGDFFESFFEDAHLLSSICGLTLTGKEAGKAFALRAPMAGVPHHAVEDKIKTLLQHDVTVAVVDQVQSAADVAPGKLVERAVTRLITPGTVVDDSLLDSKRSSYLATLVIEDNSISRQDGEYMDNKFQFGFSFADVSTGEFRVTDGVGLDALHRILVSIMPAELLFIAKNFDNRVCAAVLEEVQKSGTSVITKQERGQNDVAEQILLDFHGVDSLESLGCRNRPLCVEASSILLSFTKDTLVLEDQSHKSVPLNPLRTFALSDFMLLDGACLRNMEIIETARDGDRDRTLLWAVDRTVTSMGTRCLRSWLLAPSMSLDVVQQRHDSVEAFIQNERGARFAIQQRLRTISDLERLAGRVGTGSATPRDVRNLVESILRLPAILNLAHECISHPDVNKIEGNGLSERMTPVEVDPMALELAAEIDGAIVNPAPPSLPSEMMIRSGASWKENWDLESTQVFKKGYCKELDDLKISVEEPDSWIGQLEETQRNRTGIDNLRIKHVKNVGFVLRVPRSIGERKQHEDPMYFAKLGYERVQGTKAELRFRYSELKTHERSHHSAISQIVLLELRLYNDILSRLSTYIEHIRDLAQAVAAIDVLAGFAQVSEEQGYVKPVMIEASKRLLDLEDARHPVVEQTLAVGKTYVPNSFKLGTGDDDSEMDLMVVCGPNAAGKSCALRSIGLIYILAQAGCFVPATRATLSMCDRIFTRVGAVDDLARGQSTFQVEMAETACILGHAKWSSLVLLDEIGRGTSTVDGIAIAWSVCEYLSRRGMGGDGLLPPRTMFVTHYHELNQLATSQANVGTFRMHMEKREWTSRKGQTCEEWVATHKLVPGASFDSLGLTIAKRAGFPAEVVHRAEFIADRLRGPSRVLGAELRKALTDGDDSEVNEGETERKVENNGVEDVTRSDAYKMGFEKGVAHARLVASQQMKDLLEKWDMKE